MLIAKCSVVNRQRSCLLDHDFIDINSDFKTKIYDLCKNSLINLPLASRILLEQMEAK